MNTNTETKKVFTDVTSEFALAIMDNKTRYKDCLISEKDVSLDTLSNLIQLETSLYNSAYTYYKACEHASDYPTKAFNEMRDNVYTPLKAILSEIGLVAGFPLHSSIELVNAICGYTEKPKQTRVGKAKDNATSKAEKTKDLNKLKDELKKSNGATEEYIEGVKTKIKELEVAIEGLAESQKVLDKAKGSKDFDFVKDRFSNFRKKFEHKIATLVQTEYDKGFAVRLSEHESRTVKKKAK